MGSNDLSPQPSSSKMPKATTPISGSRQGRRHNPLETDLTATPLKIKGEKRKSRHQDEGDQFVDSKASRKILRMGQELADDDVEENSVQPANKAFDFESRLDDDEEEVPGQEEYEEWGDEEVEEIELAFPDSGYNERRRGYVRREWSRVKRYKTTCHLASMLAGICSAIQERYYRRSKRSFAGSAPH